MPAAKTLKRYGLITVACALYALGFNWFFVPNHFTVGGFTRRNSWSFFWVTSPCCS